MNDPDPLLIQRGCIQAPAGCGKTHLIAESLKNSNETLPILVLTHTNAGVAALRQKLNDGGIPSQKYKLATIDGWSMRIVGFFPQRSKVAPSILNLLKPKTDYSVIKNGLINLLKEGHINNLVESNYSRLFVDEYQDCQNIQHEIVRYLSQILPTCIFGDPLQGIFGFRREKSVNWETEVLRDFPLVAELDVPWRWKNSEATQLGKWLLEIRSSLLLGDQIDLRTAPEELSWIPVNGSNDFKKIVKTTNLGSKGKESILIICDSQDKGRQQNIARRTPGASVVENAELTDLVKFSREFDFSNKIATETLLKEAAKLLRGINCHDILTRIASIKAGRNRNPATDAELEVMNFDKNKDTKTAAAMLSALSNQSGVSAHRSEIFRNLIKALHNSASVEDFQAMVVRAREERRFQSRTLRRKSVGSTLLVKGLEADRAIVVDTDKMDAKNLYVALTRGAKSVLVCSASPILPVI